VWSFWIHILDAARFLSKETVGQIAVPSILHPLAEMGIHISAHNLGPKLVRVVNPLAKGHHSYLIDGKRSYISYITKTGELYQALDCLKFGCKAAKNKAESFEF
jgi:hypothetical protein